MTARSHSRTRRRLKLNNRRLRSRDERPAKSIGNVLAGVGQVPVADHDTALDLDPEHLRQTQGDPVLPRGVGDPRDLRPPSPHGPGAFL